MGTLALINVDTSESCWPSNEPVGDLATSGPSREAVEKRSVIDVAAEASKGTSEDDERPSRGKSAATGPHGSCTPRTSTIDATLFSPTSAGGNVEPVPMALKGLWGWMSSQRPIQPDDTPVSDADCQMAIEEKCDKLGLG